MLDGSIPLVLNTKLDKHMMRYGAALSPNNFHHLYKQPNSTLVIIISVPKFSSPMVSSSNYLPYGDDAWNLPKRPFNFASARIPSHQESLSHLFMSKDAMGQALRGLEFMNCQKKIRRKQKCGPMRYAPLEFICETCMHLLFNSSLRIVNPTVHSTLEEVRYGPSFYPMGAGCVGGQGLEKGLTNPGRALHLRTLDSRQNRQLHWDSVHHPYKRCKWSPIF